MAYYRMQSMNQSLLSLMVHGTISYEEAMHQSPDPEDLSLKLRNMFYMWVEILLTWCMVSISDCIKVLTRSGYLKHNQRDQKP